MMKLRIPEKPYYKNKEKFKKLYKSLGMWWEEGTKVGDVWRNKDFSSYLRKIPEMNGCKRFIPFNVPDMVLFLKSIGAEEYDDMIEEPVVVQVEPVDRFIDSLSPERIIRVGNNLDMCRMSEEFKMKWKMLGIKYANYSVHDLYKDIEEKNKRRRIELGIKEDLDENKEVIVKRKESNEVLLEKSSKVKKIKKEKKKKEVKVIKNKSKVEFKKKVFKIIKK